MKKIGIVGGVGWPSTVEYYAELCRLSERRHRAAGHPSVAPMPEMAIESLDIARAIASLGSEDNAANWTEFDEYHRNALQRLERSGADFAIIASNTCNLRLPEIVRGVGIPVLGIFETMAAECRRMGARQVLILGTTLTMRSERLRQVFDKADIEATGPGADTDCSRIVELIERLQCGDTAQAREEIGTVVRTAWSQRFTGPPVACLACTELPLAFPEHKTQAVFDEQGVRYVNSTALHIRDAFAFAMDES